MGVVRRVYVALSSSYFVDLVHFRGSLWWVCGCRLHFMGEVLLVHVFVVELGMDCFHTFLCSDVACSSPMATRATVGNIEMLAVADRGVSIKPDDKNTGI